MQRVHAKDHPLASPYSPHCGNVISNDNLSRPSRNACQSHIATSYSSDSGQLQYHQSQNRSPAASLIQSAARSVLDDATPSTAVSDDNSDDFSCADGVLGHPTSGRGREESFAALRSLQMKTLPAIADMQDRKRFLGCLAAVLASSYDYDEPDENVSAGPLSSDPYFHIDFDDNCDREEDLDHNTIATSTASIPNNLSAQSSSFDGSDFDIVSTEEADRWATAEQHLGQNKLSTTNMWRFNSAKSKVVLATQRHRKRRYEVLSKLLVLSAELLLLDKGASKAFLPMLTPLLVPQPNESESKERTGCNNGSQMHSEDQRAKQETGLDIDNDVLRPFVESLSPGAGLRCLSLLLLQYLLTSEVGYDARIRHVMKTLGVVVLLHDMKRDPVEHMDIAGRGGEGPMPTKDLVARATRKFESLEHNIARRIIRLSESNAEQQRHPSANQGKGESAADGISMSIGITREQLVRGVKIGSAGIVAGTLFALTGGLAAPGIAAGVAAVAGTAAATTAVAATLTSTAVVTTIFGVGGGSLAAYKMQRRTQGLTEFEFRKEAKTYRSISGHGRVHDNSQPVEAELFSTICISGWLRDKFDTQRPWGVMPTNPRITDRVELLERFYSIHSPDHVAKCTKILASWKGEERKLWSVLRQKYGRDPDNLFPLDDGPRFKGALTLEQEEVLDKLFIELGYNSVAPDAPSPTAQQSTPFERMKLGWESSERCNSAGKKTTSADPKSSNRSAFDSMHGPAGQSLLSRDEKGIVKRSSSNGESQDVETSHQAPKHLATVWDYHATYGGELYTVRWESSLLKSICDCVMDLAVDVVSGATRHLLRQTALSTLFAAITWPTYLVNVANMIDGDWTLAVERCDAAGRELARTLLFSRAGHRPVALIGFSFGARIIYTCLKELARSQAEWEDYQECKRHCSDANASLCRESKRRLERLRKKFEGMREPASIVEEAILMGLPNHLSLLSWKACRQVVAGRLVNCYSRNDYILSLMFQVKRSSVNLDLSLGSVLKPVCGTCPVPTPGVENIDVSELVSGHQDYCLQTGAILERALHGQPRRSTLCAFEEINAYGQDASEVGKKLNFELTPGQTF